MAVLAQRARIAVGEADEDVHDSCARDDCPILRNLSGRRPSGARHAVAWNSATLRAAICERRISSPQSSPMPSLAEIKEAGRAAKAKAREALALEEALSKDADKLWASAFDAVAGPNLSAVSGV